MLERVVKQLTPKLAEGTEKIADHLSEGGVIPRKGLCPGNHIGWNCAGFGTNEQFISAFGVRGYVSWGKVSILCRDCWLELTLVSRRPFRVMC